MNNETKRVEEHITYTPHKNLRWLLVMLFIAMLIFILAFVFGVVNGKLKIFLSFLFIATLIIYIDVASLTKLSVSVDADGIAIQNALTKHSEEFSWEVLKYGYYVYSAKGHKFLLLTAEKIPLGDRNKKFRDETRTLAQFRAKRKKSSYVCFCVEADYQNKLTNLIESHVIIESNR